VVGREARQTLSEDLKETINAELEKLEGFGGVEGVLLTSFVMQ
jgi:flagellar FliL protein